jgi:glycosyltransferase involved in cell wall biosynthesis
MKLALYNRGIPFDGRTAFTQPLGGSETSIVQMARELARLGHDVTVYSTRPNGGMGGGRPSPAENDSQDGIDSPKYKDWSEFFHDYPSASWDVLISFRSFDPFLTGRVAPRMIFWCGDAPDQPVLKHFGHSTLQNNIDLILCVSQWHRRSFLEAFDLPTEKVVATRNGFCPEIVPNAPTQRDWTRCAYSSTPFRGLDVLLRMFPLMRQRIMTLRLDVFSSMKVYGWNRDADQQAFGSIYKAAMQPGVTWHGSVPQPALMKHLSSTGLFLYPNTFAETSCMAAIEAQACGAVVVTTDRAALGETVENGRTGICLQGEPASAQYQREFIITVNGLLQNPSRLYDLSEAARGRAFRMYRWSSIAAEWTDMFHNLPAEPVHARVNGPLTLLHKSQDYLQNGKFSAASRVLAALDETPFLRSEVDALKGKLSTWM